MIVTINDLGGAPIIEHEVVRVHVHFPQDEEPFSLTGTDEEGKRTTLAWNDDVNPGLWLGGTFDEAETGPALCDVGSITISTED